MHRNMFGDAYCTTSEEIVDEIVRKDLDASECHADFFYDTETGEWIGEIRDNDQGDTVCFLAGFTSANLILNTLIGVGIPRGDISEM